MSTGASARARARLPWDHRPRCLAGLTALLDSHSGNRAEHSHTSTSLVSDSSTVPTLNEHTQLSVGVVADVGPAKGENSGDSQPLVDSRITPAKANAIPTSWRRLVFSLNTMMPSRPARAGLVATNGTTSAAGPEASASR